MRKPEAYCNVSFLLSIFLDYQKARMQEFPDDEEQWLGEISKFFLGNTNVTIDISPEDFVQAATDHNSEYYSPYFKKLLKNGSCLNASPGVFNEIKHNSDYFFNKCRELFFLKEEVGFTQKVEESFGITCVSVMDKKEKLPKYGSFEIVPVTRKGRIKDWSFLLPYKFPCNSAVIADNYILLDKDKLSRNLHAILEMIMPKTLKESFDLTIFTKEVKNLAAVHSSLGEKLNELFPYEVNLSIAIVESRYMRIHDRDILTNYCWYQSGAGFTLFSEMDGKVKVVNDTKVSIYPITYVGSQSRISGLTNSGISTVQTNYNETLATFRKIWKELPDSLGLQKVFEGNRKNRLLD